MTETLEHVEKTKSLLINSRCDSERYSLLMVTNPRVMVPSAQLTVVSVCGARHCSTDPDAPGPPWILGLCTSLCTSTSSVNGRSKHLSKQCLRRFRLHELLSSSTESLWFNRDLAGLNIKVHTWSKLHSSWPWQRPEWIWACSQDLTFCIWGCSGGRCFPGFVFAVGIMPHFRHSRAACTLGMRRFNPPEKKTA